MNYNHHHNVHDGSDVFPVPWSSRWSWSLHLFLGRPMFLRPFGLYCSACFGSLFVSILCTWCSHFFWYCFISFTMFCTPVFCLIHWFFSLSSFVIPSKCLPTNYITRNCRCITSTTWMMVSCGTLNLLCKYWHFVASLVELWQSMACIGLEDAVPERFGSVASTYTYSEKTLDYTSVFTLFILTVVCCSYFVVRRQFDTGRSTKSRFTQWRQHKHESGVPHLSWFQLNVADLCCVSVNVAALSVCYACFALC